MCFGPVASFSASAILAAFAAGTLSQVRSKNELLFAGFPLVFAVHQLNEGLLWLALKGQSFSASQSLLTFTFLIVALCFWPVYAPLSVYLIEKTSTRRKLMLPFLFLGFLVSSVLLWNLLSSNYSASILNCSIYYDFRTPQWESGLTFLYVAAVFGAALVSASRSMMLIGMVNIVFCGLATLVYYETFISVWCFFASLLSAMIYLFFRNANKAEAKSLV